jgi:hypothetical protein
VCGDAGSYWEGAGRATDKAGRQLDAFFDTSLLDENRRQYRGEPQTTDTPLNSV